MDVNTERIMAEIRDQIAEEQEQTVDIEAIMRDIRAQIAAEGIKEQIPAFSSVAINRPADCPQSGVDGWGQFMQSLRYINESYEIPYYWELGSANPKTFIKRLIRKLLKFLLAPIVARQNEFNAHTVRCLNSMRYFMEEQRKENQRVKDQLEQLQAQLQAANVLQEQSVIKAQTMELEQEKLTSRLQQTAGAQEQLSAEIREAKTQYEQMKIKAQAAENEGRMRAERHETAMTHTIGAVARDLMRTKWQMRDMLEAEHGDENRELHCGICGYHAPLSSFETREADCIFAGGHLKRFVCPKCGCIFGPTKFSDQTESEFDDDYTVHYAGFHEGDSTDKELYAFQMLNPSKTGIYLDYGCGSWSHTITRLRAEGYNVYGYDPYAADVDDPYVISDKERLALMRFDGIFSNDLLEHLSDPIHELQFMKLLLKSRESKMAHCTGCYNYKYEYTRFHMFFFTGKSLDVLAERAGLSVLERSNEPKTGDPCCLFGVKNDRIDLTKELLTTDTESCKDGAQAKPGKVVFGPYITLPSGEYAFDVQVALPDGQSNEVGHITSRRGQNVLQTVDVSNGHNRLRFALSETEPDIELVIENHSPAGKLSVSRLTLEIAALAEKDLID